MPMILRDTGWARRGSAQPLSKLDEAKVAQMRKEYMAGSEIPDLATRYAVSPSTVCGILKGRTWRHVVDPGAVVMRKKRHGPRR